MTTVQQLVEEAQEKYEHGGEESFAVCYDEANQHFFLVGSNGIPIIPKPNDLVMILERCHQMFPNASLGYIELVWVEQRIGIARR